LPVVDAVSDARPPSAKPPTLAARARALARDFREVARDHLELAALEAQRAGLHLTRILSAAVVISILLVSAWLALVAGGIVWATNAGVSWPAALVAAAALNMAIALVLALWIRREVGEPIFAATLRQLHSNTDDLQETVS
jgi:uncharacterized membrane protein YqjE